MFYGGYCAELEFGFDPMDAGISSRSDMHQAMSRFPNHNRRVEMSKVRSLVRYHKDAIHKASLELMAKRELRRADLLRLMKDC